MHDKKYLINNKPSSAMQIMKLACNYDSDFAECQIKSTSIASGILRDYGFTIENNPEYGKAVTP